MVSVLLVSPRQGAEVSAAEYQDVARATGLTEEELHQRMLDSPTAELGEIEDFDGIIVGGSPLHMTSISAAEAAWQHRVHEEFDRLIASPIPTMFLCYGTGYVAQAGGGAVGLSHPEVPGTTRVELTSAGLSDPLTANLPPTFTSLTGHTENVLRVGPQAVVLATGPTCPVQMLRANRSTWACQFHPDLDVPGIAVRMSFYTNHGYFDPKAYSSIVGSLEGVDTTASNSILRNFISHAVHCARPAASTVR